MPAHFGPLRGVRLIELAGLGPGPFAGMVLADMGAEIIRISRLTTNHQDAAQTLLQRGKRSLALDLKAPEAVEIVLRLAYGADGLIEGFRPGVVERLGIGPETCQRRNPRLVYGRMSGWGQTGPLSTQAGHDINYIAVTGALYSMGTPDRPPTPPLNLVGDFGGGGFLLAYGMVCALYEAARSGIGQIVDASIVDGTGLLMANLIGMQAEGLWSEQRGTNLLDGGRPEYSTYLCSDGNFVAVGAIEPQFFTRLVQGLGLDPAEVPDRVDPTQREDLRRLIADRFRTRSRDQWMTVFTELDACVSPVLTPTEATTHPHAVARAGYVDTDAGAAPSPAPRLSRTPGHAGPVSRNGADSRAILAEAGYQPEEIDRLVAAGVIATAD